MKKKTIRDIAIIICVFALGGLLMSTSQNVHDYKKERKRLQADISELQEEIHALELEWVYLNRPQRLHDLAIKHTDLRPPQPGQIRDSLIFKTSLPDNEQGEP